MQTNSTKSPRDIEDKIWNRICKIQMETGKRIHECVSSISFSYDDYHILSNGTSNWVVCSSKPNEWRGIKFQLTRKVTRVNTKWPDQSKYSSRVKRRYKKSWTKVVFPTILNSFSGLPSISDVFCHGGPSLYGDQVHIDYTFQLQKPIDHIKVDIKV